MTRKSVYQLRDMALDSGRLGYERNLVKVYASRLVVKGLASRLKEGVISFTSDPFIIATQLLEPSYISLTSALYLHELILQVQSHVECVTTHNTRRLLGIEYHRIHPKLFFGYERRERGQSYIFLAEPEKAVLDMVYLGLAYPLILQEVLPKLDRERLISLGIRFMETTRGKRVARWVNQNA
jgi:predicted transcriptional regulator of viral defense system